MADLGQNPYEARQVNEERHGNSKLLILVGGIVFGVLCFLLYSMVARKSSANRARQRAVRVRKAAAAEQRRTRQAIQQEESE